MVQLSGSDKQVVWAKNILERPSSIIEKFPDAVKDRHVRSLAQITSAKLVIDSRNRIVSWCDRAEQWLSSGIFESGIALVAGTNDVPVIRSVIY